jgi:hypothetical protein
MFTSSRRDSEPAKSGFRRAYYFLTVTPWSQAGGRGSGGWAPGRLAALEPCPWPLPIAGHGAAYSTAPPAGRPYLIEPEPHGHRGRHRTIRLVLDNGSLPRRSSSRCPCPVSKRHIKNLFPIWDRERVVIVAPLLFQLSGAHYCPVAQPQVQRHCVVKSFFRLELDQNRSGARKDRVHQCACNSTNVRTICAPGRLAEPKGRKGGSNGEVVRLGGKGCATPEWSPAMRWVRPISCTNQKRGRLGSQVYGQKGVLVARDRCPELETEVARGAKTGPSSNTQARHEAPDRIGWVVAL